MTRNTRIMTIREYAEKWNRDIDNNFAVACYDQNSLFELEDTHTSEPDETDMKTWGITDVNEYFDAVKVALIKREREY